MKNFLLVSLSFLFILHSNSQNVGIGTNNPDPSAKLDIQAVNGGILIPRIDIQSASDVTTIPSPATGLMIWNTGATFGTAGYYFNAGTSGTPSWIKVLDSASSLDDADADATNELQLLSVDADSVYLSNGNAIALSDIQTTKYNTLNESYNEGGAGLGRNINATDSAVKITGTDGLYITGNVGSGTDVEIEGAGTRMFFNPKKSAFRGGTLSPGAYSTFWDNDSIGDYSFAYGLGTKASGNYSTALGTYTEATGDFSTAMGYKTNATGAVSTVMGSNTKATGLNSIAMGYNAVASGALSIAMGDSTKASGISSTALGSFTYASGVYSTAMGKEADATGDFSTSIGNQTEALGAHSTAMGYNTNATGNFSTALGRNNTSSGISSFAIGLNSIASGQYSTVIGRNSIASNSYSIAMGYFANASGANSVAIGYDITALGLNSTAMGRSTDANGAYSTAMGISSNASGAYSTAIGRETEASGNSSVAMGRETEATGNYSTSMGYNTNASGDYSTAMGGTTNALGLYSTSMGQNTIATGFASTAMGHYATASGDFSTAMGRSTASGEYATAMGRITTATGLYSTSMGDNTNATGDYSTSMGSGTTASGSYSIALGYQTLSSGSLSNAFGSQTTASGAFSTAMGFQSNAIGNYSTAIGRENQAFSFGETVIGIGATNYTPSTNGTFLYRSANATDRLFVIGNAIDLNNNNSVQTAERSNAMVVLKNGNTGFGNNASAPTNLLHLNNGATDPLRIENLSTDATLNNVMVTDGNGVVHIRNASTIGGNDADANPTNEIQDLSLSGNTLSLSSDATTVNLSSFKEHNWYEVGQTRGADNIGDNIYTNGNVAIGSSSVTSNMKLDVNGNLFARKYVVQNSTDGGPNRGIFMWDETNSNWGIYMASIGTNKSLGNGTATSGGGASFSSHAIRFRANNSASNGFIFENSSEERLFSIRADNGRAILRGAMLFDCVNCGDNNSLDGSNSWGDLTIQGRVISASDNLHLSPPGGKNVVINDTYRAAGGTSTGTAGLQVESLAGSGNQRLVSVASNGTMAATTQMLWGSVNSNSSVSSGNSGGFTISDIGCGLYRITFSNSFINTPTVTVTQHYPGSGSQSFANTGTGGSTLDNAKTVAVTSTYADIKTGDGGGNCSDRSFGFIAIGNR